MAGTLKNYYETLGVSRAASSDEIRTAYRKLLLKFHPDKNIGDTYFEDWSKKINEAFEVLMNPQVRSEYDQVYDETRAASRQAAVMTKEAPAEAYEEEAEPSVSVDAEIQKLAPVYISAKQSYIKAQRHMEAIEARLNSRPVKPGPHFTVCGVLMLATLIWMGWTYKDLVKLPSAPAPVTAVRPSAAPVPAPELPVASQSNAVLHAEDVNLKLRVIATRADFFEYPDGPALEAKFLSRGNKLQATKRAKGYYYAIFQSSVKSSYTIEGWVKIDEVEIVAQ